MPDFQGWLQLGVGGLALAALFLGYKRIWVFGWQLSAAETDRDFWRGVALNLLKVNDKAITVAEKHDA